MQTSLSWYFAMGAQELVVKEYGWMKDHEDNLITLHEYEVFEVEMDPVDHHFLVLPFGCKIV